MYVRYYLGYTPTTTPTDTDDDDEVLIFYCNDPVGQEFLYLPRIPQDSSGFCRIPVPAKSYLDEFSTNWSGDPTVGHTVGIAMVWYDWGPPPS